jgi:hypothetical protein
MRRRRRTEHFRQQENEGREVSSRGSKILDNGQQIGSIRISWMARGCCEGKGLIDSRFCWINEGSAWVYDVGKRRSLIIGSDREVCI